MTAPVNMQAPRFVYFQVATRAGVYNWSRLHRTADGKMTLCGVKLRPDVTVPLSSDIRGVKVRKQAPSQHSLKVCPECQSKAEARP